MNIKELKELVFESHEILREKKRQLIILEKNFADKLIPIGSKIDKILREFKQKRKEKIISSEIADRTAHMVKTFEFCTPQEKARITEFVNSRYEEPDWGDVDEKGLHYSYYDGDRLMFNTITWEELDEYNE